MFNERIYQRLTVSYLGGVNVVVVRLRPEEDVLDEEGRPVAGGPLRVLLQGMLQDIHGYVHIAAQREYSLINPILQV